MRVTKILLARLVACVGLLAVVVLSSVGCESAEAPSLIEVRGVSPREIEVGDRVELRGSGFPQGRAARVTFRGALSHPGQPTAGGVTIEVEGLVVSGDLIEFVVGQSLVEEFCGREDRATHGTLFGEVEVAFASRSPAAPPISGVMHGLNLDVTPSSVRAAVLESRRAEAARVIAFLGVTPGAVSSRGLPIEALVSGSPGERAGFRVGDVIRRVDGVRVRETSDVAPASSRSAQFTLVRASAGNEETLTVAMLGYAGERIPVEYGAAFLVVGLALAALLILVVPSPTPATALEVRLARWLRVGGLARSARTFFGRGPRALGFALASSLIGTFALGPQVVSADFDGAVLLVASLGLLFASQASSATNTARNLSYSVRALVWVDVTFAGVVLAASLGGIVVHGGAFRLAEIVRSQGGAPWEFAAFREPSACVLAFAYLGALFVFLRARESGSLADDSWDAGVVGSETPPLTRPEELTRGLERMGLLLASALGVVAFFGGWQLPGAVEPRSLALHLASALVFVAKTWALAAGVLGASSLAPKWSAREARTFLIRRLLSALGLGACLIAISRTLAPSEALERVVGMTVMTACILFVLRAIVRIRTAIRRPELHASPFL